MGICVPSTMPAHCGNPHLCLNPVTTSFRLSLTGNWTYFGSNTVTMAWQTSLVTRHTVDFETPKRCPIVRKSEPVDKKLSTTLYSTGIAFVMIVSFLSIVERNSLHMYRNVVFIINQSNNVNVLLTTCSHHWLLLGLVHDDLSTGGWSVKPWT